ncbi:MAG: hypothetical protein KGI38_11190 [Thaumarchaeota archaeon]|nr:hypothetical protein [Nitrososphaerota archaeon]
MRAIEQGGLKLAIYVSGKEVQKGLNFYTSDSDFIQVGTWVYESGKELLPHIHNKGVRREIDRTQELIHVIQGRLRARLYSEDEKEVASLEMTSGDTLVLLGGGHGYEVLEDGTKVLEVKNGPYVGLELDRRRINPVSQR